KEQIERVCSGKPPLLAATIARKRRSGAISPCVVQWVVLGRRGLDGGGHCRARRHTRHLVAVESSRERRDRGRRVRKGYVDRRTGCQRPRGDRLLHRGLLVLGLDTQILEVRNPGQNV